MKEIINDFKLLDKIYLFIFGILSICFFTFYFIDFNIKKDKEYIQSIINSKLPITIEKFKTTNTIKALDLNAKDNKIIANIKLNIRSPFYSFENQTGSIKFHHILNNNTIYLQIDDIYLNNLTFNDLKEKAVEVTEKKISKFLENKLYINKEELTKVKNKISEFENKLQEQDIINEEKLKNDLYNILKSQEFKIVELGLKGMFIKDIKFNSLDNDNFEAVVVLNGGNFCLISGFGSLLIFLAWLFRKKIIEL